MSSHDGASLPKRPPQRAPERWFKCVEYAHGLEIELPFESEAEALESGIAHVRAGFGGAAKVGYYGFRSRIIVYAAAELHDFAHKCG